MPAPAPAQPPRDVLDHLGVPMPALATDPVEATRLSSAQLWALARVGLTLVVLVGGLVAPELDPLFWVVFAARLAFCAFLLSPALPQLPARLVGPIELALMIGALACTGGGDSPLRVLALLTPLLAGYLAGRRSVLAIGASSLAGYLVAAGPELVDGTDGAVDRALAVTLAVAYATAIGYAFATGRGLLSERAATSDATRRRLLNEGLSAGDRERRRVSDHLHAEALQLLLSAAQDLEEPVDGLGRARASIHDAVATLRRTVRDLHPSTRARSGPTVAELPPATDADDLDVQQRATLLFAGNRALAAPVALGLAVVGGDPGVGYAFALGASALLAGQAMAGALRPELPHLPRPVGLLLGFAALAAGVALQGGVSTELPTLALTIPFVLVLSHRPRALLVASVVLGAFLAVACAGPVLDDEPRARMAAAVLAAAYVWSVAASMLIGTGRERMRRRLTGLEDARRAVLHDSLAAAERERRRLSEQLHDGALQELMVAAQDVEEARSGNLERLVDARVALESAILQLRDIVAQLHPPALEHGGLRPAVAALLERAQRHAAFRATTDVDPSADGVRDEFVLALVREFVTNAGRHAQAGEVHVRVAADGPWLDVEVRDDGVGSSPERVTAAIADGHIGLASARERVEADGGQLRVETAPGRGMQVRARIPAAPAG